MFPTKAADKSTQPDQAAPVTGPVTDAVELILPRGMRKMFYTDPATGRRRLEVLFLLQPCLLLLVICAVIPVFRDPDLSGSLGALFSVMLALVVILQCFQYVPMKISMSASGYIYSIQLLIRSLKLEYSKQRRSWSSLECVRFQRADTVSETVVLLYG